MEGPATQELQMFLDSIRGALTSRCDREYVRKCDAERRPPYEAFEALAELGCLGVNVPEEFGGSGAGAFAIAMMLQQVGTHFLDLAFWLFRNVCHGNHAIRKHGSTEQKENLLPRLAAGEISVCFALTEPDAGSDAAALRTTAKQAARGFHVTGQKVFCSGFRVADYVMVAVRTSQERHRGVTVVMIPTSAPGLTSAPIETLGHWPLGTTALNFDDVYVPAGDVVGELGCGWAVISDMLRYERLCLSAARAGAARSALGDAITYARNRKQFGNAIATYQAVSHKLADMEVMVSISEMLAMRFAKLVDRESDTARDAAIMKLYVCEAYKAVADMSLQVFGGYGYSMEFDAQRHFRESRLGVIGAGTSEIQRNIIAKSIVA